MREWGESCLRYPDQIQPYFAKVFGDRGFWSKKEGSNSKAQVTTIDTTSDASKTLYDLGVEDLEEQCLPTWQMHSRVEQDASKSALDESPYIQQKIAKIPGDWALYSQATVKRKHTTATVYRYKLATCNCDSEDEDEDEESDDENESQGKAETYITGMLHEPSIWFLSVANTGTSKEWFYHVTKTGLLQKSAPVFVPGTPFLLWPQDSTHLLVNDTNTFASTLSKVPPSKVDGNLVLISQGSHIPLLSLGSSYEN